MRSTARAGRVAAEVDTKQVCQIRISRAFCYPHTSASHWGPRCRRKLKRRLSRLKWSKARPLSRSLTGSPRSMRSFSKTTCG